MSDMMELDDADFENAHSGFKATSQKARDRHTHFRTGSARRRRSGGKGGAFGHLVGAIERVEDVLDDGLGKVTGHLDSIADRVKQHHRNTKQTDQHHRTELDSLDRQHDTRGIGHGGGEGSGSGGSGNGGSGNGGSGNGGGQGGGGGHTPTFFVDDDGQVHQLKNGKLSQVTGTTGTHLDSVTSNGKVNDPTAKEKQAYSTNQRTRKRVGNDDPDVVQSRRLTEPSDLSLAVENVRRAKQDYSKGNNYASLRYVGEDGKDYILVGRSSNKRNHSERSIGYPLVKGGQEHGIDGLYTERRPCQSGSTCERWLYMYVQDPDHNPNLDVTHGVQYDSSVKDKGLRNAPFQRYMDQLVSDHAGGNHRGTAGTTNFD
ncbi:nucleic acid/nucleotide deaminase domain-containing protein [Peterkaempfera bronchialis]|uniref:Uncharacterized protein n=1 Tax=Peterkaempfera bronchialis TaxID=2126346 RepID=A0A345T2R1_9ACTN|nr:nucleic acid/nucleotide deaminase domain-containing protein [Peterkaempfera bronchialis]AXI80266.1 hypothetical protein C7M71_025575 [Peterkaempfera bronchialis]